MKIGTLIVLDAFLTAAAWGQDPPFIVCMKIVRERPYTYWGWDEAFRQEVIKGMWSFDQKNISFRSCTAGDERLGATLTVGPTGSVSGQLKFSLVINGVDKAIAEGVIQARIQGAADALDYLEPEIRKAVDKDRGRLYQEFVKSWPRYTQVSPGCPDDSPGGRCAVLLNREYATFYAIAGNKVRVDVTVNGRPKPATGFLFNGKCVNLKLVFGYDEKASNPGDRALDPSDIAILGQTQNYQFDRFEFLDLDNLNPHSVKACPQGQSPKLPTNLHPSQP